MGGNDSVSDVASMVSEAFSRMGGFEPKKGVTPAARNVSAAVEYDAGSADPTLAESAALAAKAWQEAIAGKATRHKQVQECSREFVQQKVAGFQRRRLSEEREQQAPVYFRRRSRQ